MIGPQIVNSLAKQVCPELFADKFDDIQMLSKPGPVLRVPLNELAPYSKAYSIRNDAAQRLHETFTKSSPTEK